MEREPPEPLRIKPHHAEGAQSFIAWGKNASRKDMLDMMQNALDNDPDAELVFVRGYDDFCKAYCIQGGKVTDCVREYGSHSVTRELDEKVAREHGWEFDKPYKVRDILEELRREAPDRTIFNVTKLTRLQHKAWLADVRASKKKK